VGNVRSAAAAVVVVLVVKQFSNWFEIFKFVVSVLPMRKVLVSVVTVEV
jgi:hypothetical protein